MPETAHCKPAVDWAVRCSGNALNIAKGDKFDTGRGSFAANAQPLVASANPTSAPMLR
jgi:hypothetical protein